MSGSQGKKNTPAKAVTTPVKKSFAEKYNTFKSTNSPSSRETKVNITNIINEDGQKVAFGVNGFFGAKEYFDNTMNCAKIILYYDRINSNINNGKITNISDVKYATMDTSSPTVLVSAYPIVGNLEVKEDINVTYQAFLTYFENNGDPINNCPIKLNICDDFILDTEDKINNFFYLTTMIQLPDRLK